MSEDNPSRKKRLGLLRRSHSSPRLAEERGRRAASDSSSLQPSRDESRGGLSRILPKSARSARQSANPEPTVAGSSNIKTTQHSSPLVASKLNPDQSASSGIAEAELPPDTMLVAETLADAQTGVAGISSIGGIVQNTASAIGDLQSNSDTINQFSAILSCKCAPAYLYLLHPYAKVALGILTQASKIILDQANLDVAISDLLSKVSDVYVLVIEKKTLANISSMIKIYTKIAQQTLKETTWQEHF
ncbi:uncharacterized protein EDB93DRAFT_1109034 [Suillus bovinus]|uniref:uncharacterized protein n=1 Tax=Suillus bovinus TaxID=48563 RepID=UPI001B87A26A|nr:uncharacterized protein EDB93DRAFT_1109034 [Suillus bovinus]KAG2128335.1 hypothetical protein EDB93DRAFT_1109034 [Suillus bovinus]